MRRRATKTNHFIGKGFAGNGLLVRIVLTALFLGTIGCRPEPSTQPDEPQNPFTVVWGPGNDRVVTFTGNSIGHETGVSTEFFLKLENNSSNVWNGRYIVQLLDSDEIVTDLADETFSVPAGMEEKIVVAAEFPENFDGPYGLSLYIPEREAQSVQTIWIGEKTGVAAGDWPSRATHPWLWSRISEFPERSTELPTLAGVQSILYVHNTNRCP
jgi:hypothetical protein